MQYAHLGRTGLVVSRLCLGTMNFGPEADEADSFAMMDQALELGINFFDTADVYGFRFGAGTTEGRGQTEEIVGRWMAQGGGRREQIVLASKVFCPMSDGINDRGLSAYHIKRACEASLRRLGTDHIDLYQMHHIDRRKVSPSGRDMWKLPQRDLVEPPHNPAQTPWEEIWQAMEQLVREGKVTYIGSSNFAGWHLAQACETARARHFLGLVSEQSKYNLNMRAIEQEVIPACRAYGLGILPWSPLDGGLLAGALEKAQGRRRHQSERFEQHRGKLGAYEALCAEIGEPPAAVALAWVLSNPVVTAPIIGPRTMEQLTTSPRATEITLSDDVLGKLDEIWPGPGGEAPESYAW